MLEKFCTRPSRKISLSANCWCRRESSRQQQYICRAHTMQSALTAGTSSAHSNPAIPAALPLPWHTADTAALPADPPTAADRQAQLQSAPAPHTTDTQPATLVLAKLCTRLNAKSQIILQTNWTDRHTWCLHSIKDDKFIIA